jgi:hypothetical protein
LDGELMAWNPDTIRQASSVAGYGQQPYAGNPYALTDDEQRRALADANGMRAQAEKVEHEPGGSLAAAPGPMTQIAQQQYAPPAAPQVGPAAEAQMSSEERGAQNQQEAIGKIGSALSAVGNFYTGNWMGAANSVRGMAGGDQEQKKKQGGAGGMDPNMLTSIMGMFGGGK